MSAECKKPKNTAAKCALCNGEHTASYKGCTVYRDLLNARSKARGQPPNIPKIYQMQDQNAGGINSGILNHVSYAQIASGASTNNQTSDLGAQMNAFLNEFKTMFSQLINQNSMILSMLSTVINKFSNGN